METFHLFHLARLCRKSTIQVAAASIVVSTSRSMIQGHGEAATVIVVEVLCTVVADRGESHLDIAAYSRRITCLESAAENLSAAERGNCYTYRAVVTSEV